MPKDCNRRVPSSECTLTSDPANSSDEVRGYVNGHDGGCIPPFGGIKFPFPGTDPTSPLDPEPPRGGGPRWPVPYI